MRRRLGAATSGGESASDGESVLILPRVPVAGWRKEGEGAVKATVGKGFRGCPSRTLSVYCLFLLSTVAEVAIPPRRRVRPCVFIWLIGLSNGRRARACGRSRT